MIQPSLDGRSADCWYSGVGSLDVHYSSGVANHFYYLLAEGTNPSWANQSNLRRWQHLSRDGHRARSPVSASAAAEKIWYRALTVYMTSSTNYAAARTATLNAAIDLYG